MGQPGTELHVVPADLVKHAGQLEHGADELGTAKSAGDQVRLDAGAYGQLCGFMPALIGKLADRVLDTLSAGELSLRDTGDKLREVAEAYQISDEQAGQVVAAAGGQP
ncbi:type VII secretion target [Hamadaea tsunoensis]|uniref:type VII secretion target n=1 Tax=Hamadaea tsunoensis TaxID=53368 RepID=UPI000424745B|nr:type VII secretion target [Hamadaea tsunoensis]